jgi:thioredoxin reductase (NADPH)
MDNDKIYKLVIIGAGPAGLAASIYASRYGVSHIIIGSILGGQISETHLIDNYPGIEDMSGFEFAKKWGRHAQKYGAEILPKVVKSINFSAGLFEIKLENGEIIKTHAVILATGAKRRKLNLPGENEFLGKGVSYCATCDGFFYKDKTVGVIGGSNSAAGAALYLGNICRKVYIIYRKNELRAEPFWVKEIEKNKKIEILFETEVREILGADKLEKVKLSRPYENKNELELDGLFIEAGSDPDIDYMADLGIKIDASGCIMVKKDGSTNIAGVWAAGDITDGSDKFRQVITAAAEGAIAARSVFNWLKTQKL